MDHKKITIKQIDFKERLFIAYFKHELFGATFSLTFNDNICGSIMLTYFLEMIKHKFDYEDIKFVISDEKIIFKNDVLLEIMGCRRRG